MWSLPSIHTKVNEFDAMACQNKIAASHTHPSLWKLYIDTQWMCSIAASIDCDLNKLRCVEYFFFRSCIYFLQTTENSALFLSIWGKEGDFCCFSFNTHMWFTCLAHCQCHIRFDNNNNTRNSERNTVDYEKKQGELRKT